MLNGLRWMCVRARHRVLWIKLLRGTLAAVMVMFFIRLMVVPGDTFRLTGHRRPPIYRAMRTFTGRWKQSWESSW